MIKTIADALSERGYETLTDVQEAVSEPELQNADLLVSAQTGSGKTVGFGLAIAPTLLGDEEHFGRAAAPMALVIAPTRELAMQVNRELAWLFAKAGVRMASCVGGMDAREERRALERGAHIVVGTPGRLRDHITKGALVLDDIRAVILDEADEMLDMGFREDLEFMLAEAPEDRRTLMFSATVPAQIAKMAKQFQRDAVRVSTVSSGDQHADISYQAMTVHHNEVENAIINLLRYHDSQTSIVFANTRAAVARLMSRFSNRGFSVVSLSGELSQTERTHALQAMRDGRAKVCVATDVAARGIDLPNLELVIHADLPQGSEALLHRSGRTGRAGRKGISALIATPKTVKKAERLLQWAKVRAEWVTPPSAEQILQKDQERLLNDPVWDDEPTKRQSEFAETLLAKHSPEKIAAAYLRLYQSRQSAPEDLSTPDAKPARKSHEEFGPSTWFSVSVGRANQAEPRWLLPMVLRAGNLDKNAIGAIRVQQNESYIEVSDGSVDRMMTFLDGGGELEEGIRMTKLDGAPDLSGPRHSGPRNEGFKRDGPRPQRRDNDKPAGKRVWDDKAPRKPRRDDEGGKPKWQDSGKVKPRPAERSDDDKPKPYRKKEFGDGEKPFKKKDGDKPFRKPSGDKPFRKSDGDKPFRKPSGDKPYRKKDGAPSGDKPFRKKDGDGDRPFRKSGPSDDKPRGKPGAASASKSFRKPRADAKPGGKPKSGGAGKPGKKTFGGNDVPRKRK
ncbi:MAG: DEAD/DEAH box helicase [Paracoccaceae bacterium]|jgi:ATP-dependent RNA helicase DeaD|nr:DEAD/DEAH box helicase [Paracoccaceae bacterium]